MTEVTETADAGPAPLSYPGYGAASYRAYVLGALLVVYTFNFIDRVVIAIIQEPIKHEFALTDFQLGLLGGPAFAVLYTFLGIPIARLAERKNRMTILTICLAIWSGMTALCGFANSYAMLLMARIGVSVGEAGCTPPAQSVLSDYFPAKSRATATAVLLFIVNLLGYGLGPPVIGALSDFLANMHMGTLGVAPALCEGAAAAGNAACVAASEFGLRWAIFIGLFGYLWAGVHFLLAWRTLRRDWVG